MKIKYYQMGEVKFTLLQMQYLSKLRDGLLHKEIKDLFQVSQGTVDHTVSYLIHKAHVKNSKELVALSVANGLKPKGIFNGKNLFKKPKKNTKK